MRREYLQSSRTKQPTGIRMFALLWIVCGGFGLLCARSAAETLLPIAPEPVGSGARALGQSAFIAVADDATAASWNPAGLIILENPEFSVVGIWRAMSNDLSTPDPGFSLEGGSWDAAELNFMSYTQPVPLGNTNAVLSINYHQVYDLGLEYTFRAPRTGAPGVVISNTAEGAISAYSLAGAITMPFYRPIAIGMSFNWYTQSLLNGEVRRFHRQGVTYEMTPPLVYERTTEILDDLGGYNFDLGLLWDIYEREESLLTLGFVCHTPFSADVDQEVRTDGVPAPPADLDIDFPLSLGAGAHYRFSDDLSAAVDVQWTDWSAFTYTHTVASPSPQDDAWAARLGFEKLWFSEPSRRSVYALRGGLFYEPRPAWTDILPVYGVSVGLGWTAKKRFSLDLAYQFRWGEQDDILVEGGAIDYRIAEHWLVSSVIVYF
jgi:long-subunit fatty acid transport protein